MGLVGLNTICTSLIQHGAPADLPIALIQQGTTRTQRVITATLSTIYKKIEHENIQAPTLFIIGTVVSLHNTLKWFKPNNDL